MTWIPPQRIRVVVVALVARGDRWLVCEVPGEDGRVKGVRPLGGGVEFGETREAALAREIREELGTAVSIRGGWHVLENLFEHAGAVGHEIVFAALADVEGVPDGAFDFTEDGGASCRARWMSLDQIEAAGLDLYPAGLAEVLRRALS